MALMAGLLKKIFGDSNEAELKRIGKIADQIDSFEEAHRKLTDEQLRAKTQEFRERLQKGETLDDILPEAYSVVREATYRVTGKRQFRVQMIGGVVLHQGRIAEMKTGEGKTLTSTMPAYLNALTGEGVHIVTVNDYLARFQGEDMGRIHRFLGLTVGIITHDLTNEQRRAAYACDITYGTNNELGFDYLRDNMVIFKKDMVQRGHHFAIVDEVDSILIDEARTPLIISGQGEKSTDLYTRADRFVRTLQEGKEPEKTELELMSDEEAARMRRDFVKDEKQKTCNLSEEGARKAEKFFGIANLSDAENNEILHHINAALRAHSLMRRDVDYVVQNDQVVIVDEFTGRLMVGRRYSDGLHQAIEAKEGVKVERENRTLATITFQNYFRMYKKLAGMTGTARTEATEFTEIYGLNIVTVPTNKPNIRKDYPDVVYSTVAGKYRAVIDQVMECHAKGQPVLVGTVSVEKSELLAKMLQKRTKDFNVLNAKNHEREAEIVAQAGKKGAITIATNMAGRGTDIMLGGNAEFMAKAQMRREQFCEKLLNPEAPQDALPEQVEALLIEADGHGDTDDANILAARARFDELYRQYKEEIAEEAEEVRAAGGLFIIGTERHESRRIDNQLRGRAGRQGDPGASRFYLSLEDDLMRLFGGERVQGLMNSMGLDEDTPIETRMITSTIESAQKKLEGRNFEIRKNVLRYDDVMNQQREIIYGQRHKVLDGEDVSADIHKMLRDNVDSSCALFLAGEDKSTWDFAALRRHYSGWLTTDEDFHYTDSELAGLTAQSVADTLYDRGIKVFADKEARYGANLMRELERICLLRCVDRYWMDHIDNMDQLRKGISLRSYGQKDPVVEYRIEGFDMFDQMVDSIREDTVKMLLMIEVRPVQAKPGQAPAQPARPAQPAAPAAAQPAPAAAATPKAQPAPLGAANPAPAGASDIAALRQKLTGQSAGAKAAAAGQVAGAANKPVRVGKIGRNDPCPCGSGLKWKKCTCQQYHPDLYAKK